MKIVSLIFYLGILVNSLLAQSDSQEPQAEVISIDQLSNAKTLADLTSIPIDWEAVDNANITYKGAGSTNIHVLILRDYKLTDAVRELFSNPSIGDQIWIDNIHVSHDGGSSISTSASVIVQ